MSWRQNRKQWSSTQPSATREESRVPLTKGKRNLPRSSDGRRSSRDNSNSNGGLRRLLLLLPPLLRRLRQHDNLSPEKCNAGKVVSWALPRHGPPSLRFDGSWLPHPVPVGARLLYFHHEWDTLTTDAFVRSVVRDGYRIELDCLPTLSPVPIPMRLFPGSEKAKALGREIASLLNKQAIEELDPRSLTPGFYSRIFLVPKKD